MEGGSAGEGMGSLVALPHSRCSSAEPAFPKTPFWLLWDRDDETEHALWPWSLEPLMRFLTTPTDSLFQYRGM